MCPEDEPKAILIDRLRSADTLGWSERKRLLQQVMKGYVARRLPIYFPSLYRARPFKFSEGLYRSLSELWYPPSHKVKAGRANRDGEPMFYASENWHTAFKETIADGHVAMGLEVALRPDARRLGYFAIGGRERFTRTGALKPPENDELVEEFLTTEFRRGAPRGAGFNYSTCSLVSELFFDHPGFDGLVYPSVPFGFKWMNVALRPSAVDLAYEARSVIVVVEWMNVWARIGVGCVTDDSKIIYSCESDAIETLPGITAAQKQSMYDMFDRADSI